jgi:hypothetical protein
MISGENPNIPSRWIRYRPDALIRLDFFFKKAKKTLDKGVCVWYSMQARPKANA